MFHYFNYCTLFAFDVAKSTCSTILTIVFAFWVKINVFPFFQLSCSWLLWILLNLRVPLFQLSRSCLLWMLPRCMCCNMSTLCVPLFNYRVLGCFRCWLIHVFRYFFFHIDFFYLFFNDTKWNYMTHTHDVSSSVLIFWSTNL